MIKEDSMDKGVLELFLGVAVIVFFAVTFCVGVFLMAALLKGDS